MTRHLHPAAWWIWAIGLAATAGLTTNPVLLGAVILVLTLVVLARRDGSPWARAFGLYAVLAGFVVIARLVLHVLVGLKFGTHRLFPLPEARLPDWAAGIQLGGDIYLEGALAAALEGARLGTMILAIGAANALASPKRLLKVFPAALHEVGAALVVAVTVAPHLADSVLRVRRARLLRGDNGKGLRAFRSLAMPILQDTLDRSLALAAAMDGRGYGRRAPGQHGRRTATLTTIGLLGACIGSYGILDTTTPAALGLPMLVLGVTASIAGLWSAGRGVARTIYRRDPWAWPEWLTTICGVLALGLAVAQLRGDPSALAMPLTPLGVPPLPSLALSGTAFAILPAIATPVPPLATTRPGPRMASA